MVKYFKLYLTIIFVIFLLNSCSNVYSEQQKIKDLQWFKTDVKIFEVYIPEDGNYDLFFTMRHSIGYPFTSIKIKIEQITPNNKEFLKKVEFSVIDKERKYIGNVTGQLWDTENLFSKNTFLKKGNYVFRISHAMNSNPVILVIDIGLIVRKSKI